MFLSASVCFCLLECISARSCPAIHLSISPPVSLSVRLSICPSVHMSFPHFNVCLFAFVCFVCLVCFVCIVCFVFLKTKEVFCLFCLFCFLFVLFVDMCVCVFCAVLPCCSYKLGVHAGRRSRCNLVNRSTPKFAETSSWTRTILIIWTAYSTMSGTPRPQSAATCSVQARELKERRRGQTQLRCFGNRHNMH